MKNTIYYLGDWIIVITLLYEKTSKQSMID